MNNEDNPFANFPDFKETIARIARVPPYGEEKKEVPEFAYIVRDESDEITYKIVSGRKLSPGDVRRVLARAFTRTDAWPSESGEVEISA